MSKGSKKLKGRKAKRAKRRSDPDPRETFHIGDQVILDNLPEEPTPIRAELLNAARDLTCGPRQESYGDPKFNIGRIAAIRAAFWAGSDVQEMVTDWGTAMDMVLTNIGRISAAPTEETKFAKDRYADGTAYLAIAYELSQRS